MLPANNTCMARENVSMPSVCENLVNVIGQTVRNENLKILETNVKRKAKNNDARDVEPKRSAFTKLENVNFNHNNKITIHPDDAVKQRGEPTKKGDKRNDVQQSGEQTQQECCVMQKYEKGKIVMETNCRKLENSDNNKNITSIEVENVAGTSQSKNVTENKLICQTMPNNDEDFDRTNCNDPLHVSQYAMDIFKYLKERETAFPIDDYMKRQVNLSKNMRAILVDWMVGAQETMAFNDGSLHLAVKIVDLFLCKVVINKDKLQLLGATALFIACKFDNRTIPLIGELVYVCGDNYKYDDFIRMEISILRAIDFDLGVPLAYEFLRRYSYCGRVAATTLTLARYILEISLMYYDTVTFSDSKMAAAALFIALRMFGVDQGWNITLKYYSGYKLTDFVEIIIVINGILHRKPKSDLNNVREKYISETFYEVARVPFMTTPNLFKDNLDYI